MRPVVIIGPSLKVIHGISFVDVVKILKTWLTGLRGNWHDAEGLIWSFEKKIRRKNYHYPCIRWHIASQEECSEQSLQESTHRTLQLPRLKFSRSSKWNRKNIWTIKIPSVSRPWLWHHKPSKPVTKNFTESNPRLSTGIGRHAPLKKQLIIFDQKQSFIRYPLQKFSKDLSNPGESLRPRTWTCRWWRPRSWRSARWRCGTSSCMRTTSRRRASTCAPGWRSTGPRPTPRTCRGPTLWGAWGARPTGRGRSNSSRECSGTSEHYQVLRMSVYQNWYKFSGWRRRTRSMPAWGSGMTRSDEIWTWCLKVIKRPPCDNILASNLPLRPASSARHRSIGICLLSLSSYPESRPCVWLQISTTWLKNKLKSMPNISVTYKPNVCFHQKIQKYVYLFFAN